MKKKIVPVLLSVGFVAMPLFAFAATGDLVIFNNTPEDSTSKIHGICTTTVLGSDGITKPGQHHPISSAKVKLACATMHGDCDADVFMNDNCSGTKVATVHFNVDTGYKGYDQTNANYAVKGTGFNVEIDKIG